MWKCIISPRVALALDADGLVVWQKLQLQHQVHALKVKSTFIRINFILTLILSRDSTDLHHSCHTDKGTSRHFLGQWRTPHMTAGNRTFPSSFPCQVALLFPCFYLQGSPKDPVPQRELLVWPLLGSLSPLYSAQSSPWWDHYRPVGSGSHSVLTACNGGERKVSVPVRLSLSHWVWLLTEDTECAETL